MGGSNKPHSIARVDVKGITAGFARAHRSGNPETLTPAEIALDREPCTRPPEPVPVLAWVRYRSSAVLVAGDMVAWTGRASAIRWLTVDGEEHRAWVWSGAVRERPAEDLGRWATAAERGAWLTEIAARSV